MNFLAHLYLSGPEEDVILGNFFADAVKGNSLGHFPPDVEKGIRLHREIDSYTDSHPVVRQSTSRLHPTYSKFSGVVVDMYYDHFLARNWNDYSDDNLEDFVARAYKMLLRRYDMLPGRSRRILPFMIAQNWLVGYADYDRLARVFQGMARRTRYRSGMENAVEDLKKDYEHFESEFRSFFPDIVMHIEQYRNDINVR